MNWIKLIEEHREELCETMRDRMESVLESAGRVQYTIYLWGAIAPALMPPMAVTSPHEKAEWSIKAKEESIMWPNAKPIDKYYTMGKEAGMTYSQMQNKLHVVDYRMAEYGDWTLFRDDDGNLWEQYESIGD